MIVEFGAAANVVLKIDSAIVYASRQHVEASMGAHEAKPDPHPQYINEPELEAALYAERMARRAQRFFHATL